MEEKLELTIDQKIELMKLALKYAYMTRTLITDFEIEIPKAYQYMYRAISELPLVSP